MFLFNILSLKFFRTRRKQLSDHSSLPLHQPLHYSGVIMKDLVALDTALKNHVEHQGQRLINFHKMVQVSDILQQVTGLRYTPPEVDPDKELSNIMRVSVNLISFSLRFSTSKGIKVYSVFQKLCV